MENHRPIAYLAGEGHAHVFRHTTGEELPGFNIPDGHQARALTATITDITTFTYRRNPHHSMSILPISIATCHERIWATVNLEDTPTEAF
jgi:hypothetical protein